MMPLLLLKPLCSSARSLIFLGTRTYFYAPLFSSACIRKMSGLSVWKKKAVGGFPGLLIGTTVECFHSGGRDDFTQNLFISFQSVEFAVADRWQIMGTVILSSPGVKTFVVSIEPPLALVERRGCRGWNELGSLPLSGLWSAFQKYLGWKT
jgi:hypothetical protein